MVNLFYDCYNVLSKVYSEKTFIKQALASTVIEPLNKPKTVKICYGVLDKDIELDYYIGRLCDKAPKLKIKILIKIALYSIKYLEKKPYAVINSTVELVKKLGKGANASFVNAVLRRFCVEDILMPEDKIEYLSVKYSYPVFAVKKLIDFYGESVAESVMAYDEEKTFVRFNSGVDGEKYLTENGYSFEKTPFYNLFSVLHISINEDFEKGLFTFQSIGSVAICEVAGSGDALFDACAGPGGKSAYLSDKFKSVVACELHPHRADLIKAYVERMNKTNVNIVCADSTKFDPRFENRFDRVLCDVPCSGYGTIKSNPDIKLNRGEQAFLELNKTQFEILSNCARYVKVGGAIVYSTCSVFDDENDFIVERFLNANDGFKVEKIESPLYSVQKKYGLQFLPQLSFGAGFYCARLLREK